MLELEDKNTEWYCCFFNFIEDSEESDPIDYIDFGVSDGYGGMDNITVFIEVYDLEPPDSVSNIECKAGRTYINCSWTNPADFDFSHVMFYLNGELVKNVTSNFYRVDNLNSGSVYEIGIRTVDITGFINDSWVNLTVQTEKPTETVRRSSRGGGGGGGGSIILSPKLESVAEVKQTEIRYFQSGKPVLIQLSDKIKELTGVKEIKAVSDKSSILMVTVASVKEFKNMPSAGYTVHSMFEIVFSNNGISVKSVAGEITFMVPKDFVEDYNILLLRYNATSDRWEKTDVDKSSENENYAYFSINLTSFGVFAIAGVKKRTAVIFPQSIPKTGLPVLIEEEQEEIKISKNVTGNAEKIETLNKTDVKEKEKKLGSHQLIEFITGIVIAFAVRTFTRKN